MAPKNYRCFFVVWEKKKTSDVLFIFERIWPILLKIIIKMLLLYYMNFSKNKELLGLNKQSIN